MTLKFYKCNTCGNIIVKIEDSNVTPSCCGKMMTELHSESTDGELTKHIPVFERWGHKIDIKVGQEEHPMTEMHHVDFVILRTNKGVYFHKLFCSKDTPCKPQTSFFLEADEQPLEIYEYCNLHGLFYCDC